MGTKGEMGYGIKGDKGEKGISGSPGSTGPTHRPGGLNIT